MAETSTTTKEAGGLSVRAQLPTPTTHYTNSKALLPSKLLETHETIAKPPRKTHKTLAHRTQTNFNPSPTPHSVNHQTKETRNPTAVSPNANLGGTHSSRKLVGGVKTNLSTASQHLTHFYQHALATNQSMSHSTSRYSVVLNALEPPPPLPEVKHQPTNKFYDTTFSKAFVSHQ